MTADGVERPSDTTTQSGPGAPPGATVTQYGVRPPEQRRTRRPWGWIGLAAVLGAAVIGLAVYAVQVNSDLDDAEATVAEQEQALSELQDTRGAAGDAIASVVGELTSALGATQAEVDELEQQVNAAADSLRQAEDEISAAASELQRTEAERDAAQAKVEVVQTCAQSVMAAFSGAFEAQSLSAGVQAAAADLRALQPQCAPALSD